MRTWVDTSKWPAWRLRAEKVGLTVGALARATDTAEPTVRKWANGTRRGGNPPEMWLAKVEDLLAAREAAA